MLDRTQNPQKTRIFFFITPTWFYEPFVLLVDVTCVACLVFVPYCNSRQAQNSIHMTMS
jgi:hypothetical protein